MTIFLFKANERRGDYTHHYQLYFRYLGDAKRELENFANRAAKDRPMAKDNRHLEKGEYIYSAYNCDEYFYAYRSKDDFVKATIEPIIVI